MFVYLACTARRPLPSCRHRLLFRFLCYASRSFVLMHSPAEGTCSFLSSFACCFHYLVHNTESIAKVLHMLNFLCLCYSDSPLHIHDFPATSQEEPGNEDQQAAQHGECLHFNILFNFSLAKCLFSSSTMEGRHNGRTPQGTPSRELFSVYTIYFCAGMPANARAGDLVPAILLCCALLCSL